MLDGVFLSFLSLACFRGGGGADGSACDVEGLGWEEEGKGEEEEEAESDRVSEGRQEKSAPLNPSMSLVYLGTMVMNDDDDDDDG